MANPYLFPSFPYSSPKMTMSNLFVQLNKKALSIFIGTAIILYSVLEKIVILTILILTPWRLVQRYLIFCGMTVSGMFIFLISLFFYFIIEICCCVGKSEEYYNAKWGDKDRYRIICLSRYKIKILNKGILALSNKCLMIT